MDCERKKVIISIKMPLFMDMSRKNRRLSMKTAYFVDEI